MKKTILSLVLVGSMIATPTLASTPTESAVAARIAEMQREVQVFRGGQWQVYTAADRMESQIGEVMKLNKITREEAQTRIYRAMFSQSGRMGKSPIWPNLQLAYDPSVHAWRNAFSRSFYAGYNPLTGAHVLTLDQRAAVTDDTFWYCTAGLTYTYGEGEGECK